MINYNLEEFKKTIKDADNKFEPAYFKNFIDEDHIPSWQDFLNCIYEEWQEPTNNDLATIVAGNNEKLTGTVIVGKNLYINALNGIDNGTYVKERFKKYFPEIFKMTETLEQKCGISINLAGPKVCVGPYQNLSHKDSWPAFSLQCQGQTYWTISDKSLMGEDPIKYQKTFEMNPGDLLFFPEGIYHQIEVSAPRASLQFRSWL
jgi:hypothetical protein